ncbi:putative glycosyl transferase [Roseovarius albus]|uniref:Putative glycosyl transferase n=1 Tax=Roseovarius albus TaxID=1247867 RepID=A0A1X6ZJP1_9RHOB|nr:glycosyltransferase family 2 protein [Roseovarius albus]SLN53164.1 putative glycosyl transferase [Roseovarius albus]
MARNKVSRMSETRDKKIERTGISVIIAARDEESYIGGCLKSLLAQVETDACVEVIVAANACTDRTIEVARSYASAFDTLGWSLAVLDVSKPGKTNALNAGEAEAKGTCLVYLDADVRCDPELLGQLFQALSVDMPRYATGTLQVMPAKSWVTKQYARFWQRLPFVKSGGVGAGLFALNRMGRARWAAFPDIMSDDTFVRLNFAPDERVEVPARYHWPMIEGLKKLVRVRRRQDVGVEEVAHLYPDLMKNDDKIKLGSIDMLKLLLVDPVGFVVFGWVWVLVRFKSKQSGWVRGR